MKKIFQEIILEPSILAKRIVLGFNDLELTCLTTVLVPLFHIHNPILYSWAVIIQANLSSDPFFELDPILAGQIRPITIRFKPSTDHLP